LPERKTAPAAPEAEPEVVQPSKELKIVTRLREQHAAAHELWAQGMSKAAIGLKLGLHQVTVRKLVNARSADDVVAKSLQRAHVVDPYVSYLHRGWNEGMGNAAQLHRKMQNSAIPEASWPSSVTCGATAPGADTHPPPVPSLGPRGHLMDHDPSRTSSRRRCRQTAPPA